MSKQIQAYLAEIGAISGSGEKDVFYRLVCTLHANGKDIATYHVNDIELERNYIEQYADIMSISVAISAGSLQYDVMPYKASLEATVEYWPMSESQIPKNEDSLPLSSYRYRAVPYDGRSKTIESGDITTSNQQTMDRTQAPSARFQLLDPALETLRMKSVGGPYRKIRGVDLIRYLLTKMSREDGEDASARIKGVTVAEGFNPEVREHIVIPHLTPLIAAPLLINQICGGIYPAGFQFYLQNQFWYLYPPYNTKGYTAAKRTLTVMKVPKGRFPNPERSYRETPAQLIVLSTGETKHNDLTNEMQLNAGNGIRFMDAARVMDGFIEVDGNKATVKKSGNVTEFIAETQDTGLNMVVESGSRITANYLTEYAKIAARNGAYIRTIWENSNDTLLYPGMPVKYLYVENDAVQELYGTLVGSHTVTQPTNTNPKVKRFAAQTVLTLFVEKKPKTRKGDET